MAINETVLEMHFHKPLMDLFRSTYGVGTQGMMSFYKYSPQKEVFVGFDQAYAMTELRDDQFFDMLKESAATATYKLPKKFLAFFLQFKVVRAMSNIQKHTPPAINKKPHYRVKLDTTKNQNTGMSQHELLFQLCKNDGAMVYYACPMIFDKVALYEVVVDLDPLRLVDVSTCPSQYSDNDTHHIYFNEPLATPVWCSTPVEGEAIGATELANKITARLGQLDASASALQLISLLSHIRDVGNAESSRSVDGVPVDSAIAFVHDSLTIIQVEQAQ